MKIFPFKNLISSKQPDLLPSGENNINVYRDWKVILLVSFFVAFLLIVWSLYLLNQIKNDEFSKVGYTPQVTRSAVNEKKLEAVSSIFLEKAKKHEELKNTPLPVSDPSR